ncbi:MAG: DUF560 domain-containing protein [Gammaproteobacteria bacterium]|nr:DUF560 domain-containing protein [Gammaproteobacteria bacterium]
MKTIKYILTCALLAGYGITSVSYAQSDKASFGFDVDAGYHSDSNVGIADIDSNSGESDTAVKIGLGVNAEIPLGERFGVRVGYDFDDTAYQELSEFDLSLHHGVAEISTDFAGFGAAVAVDRYVANLDGEEYLGMTQVSPSLSRLFGSSLFARIAYMDATKEYDLLSNRDASNEAMRVDVYWLLDGMNRYIALGMQTSDENAIDDELDFESVQSMLTYGQSLRFSKVQVKLKTQLKLENRDYLNVTEAIQDTRRDDRLRASLSAAIPLPGNFELKGIVEHARTESNLDSADTDKLSYGVSVSASF